MRAALRKGSAFFRCYEFQLRQPAPVEGYPEGAKKSPQVIQRFAARSYDPPVG